MPSAIYLILSGARSAQSKDARSLCKSIPTAYNFDRLRWRGTPHMARLDFAFWDAVGGYGTSTEVMADIYDEHIRLAQRVEEMGWHSYFVIEHQNSPIGRITAPTVYLTAVARATTKLRIGAMMWQLPLYHPIRLAQEVAMLDQLSRGRVEFGTGIGVHEHEFIRWGVDYYQRAAIAGEVLQHRQDGLDAGRGHVQGQVFHLRRGAAAAQAVPEAVSADLGRGPQRRRDRVRRAQQFPRLAESRHRRGGGAQVRSLSQDLARVRARRADAARLPAAPGPCRRDRRQGARGGAAVSRQSGRRRGAGRRRPDREDADRLGHAIRAAWAATASAPTTRRAATPSASAGESYEFNIDNGLALVGIARDGAAQARRGQEADRLRHLLRQPRDRPHAQGRRC